MILSLSKSKTIWLAGGRLDETIDLALDVPVAQIKGDTLMSIGIIVVGLLIALIPSIGFSQTGLLDTSKVILPHKDSKALEFRMSGLFNLGSYMNSSLALKSFSAPNKAVLYVLDFGLDSYGLSGDGHEYNYDPSPSDSTIDSTYFDRNTYYVNNDISLSVQWIKYKEPYGNLSLLFGVGPIIGMSVSHRENTTDPRGRTSTREAQLNNDVSMTVYTGLTPVVGIEWFLHKNFSFHAEYYSIFRVGWRNTKDSTERRYDWGDWFESEYDISGLYYNARGYAAAGVSFYFK